MTEDAAHWRPPRGVGGFDGWRGFDDDGLRCGDSILGSIAAPLRERVGDGLRLFSCSGFNLFGRDADQLRGYAVSIGMPDLKTRLQLGLRAARSALWQALPCLRV